MKKTEISIEKYERLDLIMGVLLVIFGVCDYLILNNHAIYWFVTCILLVVLIASTFLFRPEDNDEYSIKCRGMAARFSWKITLLTICLITLLGLFIPISTEVCWIVIGVSIASYSASYLYYERKGD